MSTKVNAYLSQNKYRQVLRISCGSSLGFLLSQAAGWNFGVFFTIFPLLLLGLAPELTPNVIRQYAVNAIVTSIEVLIVFGLFGDKIILMSFMVFFLFLYRFILMSKGPFFFFASLSLVNVSMQLHFASYPSVDVSGMVFSNLASTFLTIWIALAMHWLIPNIVIVKPPSRINKSIKQMRHEILLGTFVASISFISFQVLDLKDALAAQTATVLILMPMAWQGIIASAKTRIIGNYIGCLVAIFAQLIAYNYTSNLVLATCLYWVCILYFSKTHVIEGLPGVGFSGATTIAILFGHYLTPSNDLILDSVYRVVTVSLALAFTILLVFLLNALLNNFELTKINR